VRVRLPGGVRVRPLKTVAYRFETWA
jgi:hypothetical protein